MSRRLDQLSEEVREEVARIIGRELSDPRIGFVTVTRVDLAPDLKHARVYVGVLGDKAQHEKTLLGLKQASGFVRQKLGQRLRLRHIPMIEFQYDKGLDATDRVARLLEEISQDSDPERT